MRWLMLGVKLQISTVPPVLRQGAQYKQRSAIQIQKLEE